MQKMTSIQLKRFFKKHEKRDLRIERGRQGSECERKTSYRRGRECDAWNDLHPLPRCKVKEPEIIKGMIEIIAAMHPAFKEW